MNWVVLGDECVLAPAPAEPGAPPPALPSAAAAAAIARLNQSGYTVVLASHYAPSAAGSADLAEPPTPALRYAFWHALAAAGAQLSAVFFWPDAADGAAAGALFREIGTRYELGPRPLIALFTRPEDLQAARQAGCQVFAVAPVAGAAGDLTSCVAQIIARPADAAPRLAADAEDAGIAGATEPPAARAA